MILKSSHCAEIIIIFFPPYLKLSGKCPPCRRCARCGPDTAGTALAGLRAPSPSGCYPGGTRGIPSPSTVSTRPGPPATAGPPEPLPPPGDAGPPQLTYLLAEHKPSASGRVCPPCSGGTRLQRSKGERRGWVRGGSGSAPTMGTEQSPARGRDASQGPPRGSAHAVTP